MKPSFILLFRRVMCKHLSKNLQKKIRSILDIDNSIRFAGLIRNDGTLLTSHLREGVNSLLDTEESKKSYTHVVLRATSYKSMNKKLGRIVWSIELREKIKWISAHFKDENILILSTEVNSDHDTIVKKILDIFAKYL